MDNKRIYIGYNEVMHLLSLKSFEEYVRRFDHIYVTFTQNGSYFVVEDFDGNALAICTTLPELEAYYGNSAGEDNTEEA